MPLNLKDKLLSSYQKLKDSTTLDERVGSLLKPLQTGLQQAELARIASAREGYAPKTARLTQFQNRIESTPVLGTIASYPKSRGISAAKNIIGGLETANKGGAGNAALGGLGIGYGLMKINPFNPVGSAALSIREPALASALQNYRQRGGVGGFLNTLNTNIKNPYTGVATTGLGMKDNLLGMAADFALDPDITPGLVNKVASRGKAIAKGFDFGRNSRSTWSPDELGMLDQINDFLRKNKTLKNFEADKIDEMLTYLQRSHVPEETIQKIANQYGGNTVGYMKAMTKELQKLAKSSPTSTNYNWDLGLGITDAQPTKGDIDNLAREARKHPTYDEFEKTITRGAYAMDDRGVQRFGRLKSIADNENIYRDGSVKYGWTKLGDVIDDFPELKKLTSNGKIEVYRSAPGKIEPGDWVGTTKKVATQFQDAGRPNLYTEKVDLGDLYIKDVEDVQRIRNSLSGKIPDKELLSIEDVVYAPKDALGSVKGKTLKELYSLPQPTKGDMGTWYHGTNKRFNEFRVSTTGDLGKGYYLTDTPTSAQRFAWQKSYAKGGKQNIIIAEPQIKNPLTLGVGEDGIKAQELYNQGNQLNQTGSKIEKLAKDRGYDAVIRNGADGNEMVVFNNKQIKIHDQGNIEEVFSKAEAVKQKLNSSLPQPTKGDTTLNDLQKSGLVSGFAGGKSNRRIQDNVESINLVRQAISSGDESAAKDLYNSIDGKKPSFKSLVDEVEGYQNKELGQARKLTKNQYGEYQEIVNKFRSLLGIKGESTSKETGLKFRESIPRNVFGQSSDEVATALGKTESEFMAEITQDLKMAGDGTASKQQLIRLDNNIKKLKNLVTKLELDQETYKINKDELGRVTGVSAEPGGTKSLKTLRKISQRQESKAKADFEQWQKAVVEQSGGNRTVRGAIDVIARNIQENTKPVSAADLTNTKDISNVSKGWNTVYRNFKQVYGDKFPQVKKQILDPFDASKGRHVDELEGWAGKLESDIVNGLGIKKNTPESAAVQLYGEGKKTYQDLVKEFGDQKAQDIIKADQWFRQQYDQLLDQVNAVRKRIYPNNPDKLIPKRKDYYRHFREMKEGFGALLNIFDQPNKIAPGLESISEQTKPKSKWLSFAQRRLGDKSDIDAVGGFIDYIRSASYAKNIDPHIQTFRNLREDLVKATGDVEGENYAQLNNFINFLDKYANDLSGKTNQADRIFQEYVPGGRQTFAAINWLNNRVKANTILANASSALAQIFNVPQGIASAGVDNSVRGAGRSLTNIFSDNKAISKSTFIKERYSDPFSRFDTGILNNTKKFAGWMISVLDDVGTRFIWNSHYEKALKEGIQDPIKYADDITRNLVGGRGIGEVPLLQKAKVTQLVAPFQLEVANLWYVMKDFVDKKQFGKLATMFITMHVMNKAAESIRGSNVGFDPIEAMVDMWEISQEEDGENKTLRMLGRGAGEVLSNVPVGQSFAAAYPEYGFKVGDTQLPTREQFFGDEDPTRFGSGLLLTKALQDPLSKIIPPFGGTQIKRTLEGLLATNQGYSESKSGRVRYPIEQNLRNTLQAGIFGQYSVPEAREYFDNNRTPLGENQSELFRQTGDKKTLYDQVMGSRDAGRVEDRVREQVKSSSQSQYAGTKLIYYNPSSEQVESIDIGRVATMPENSNLAKALKEKEVWATTNKVMKADITPEQKQQALEALGVKPEEATYYSIATYDGDIKMAYLKDILPQIKDRNTLLKTLSMMRGEVNGERILNDDMINELYDEGIIGANEKSMLKNLKFKDGKIVNSGKGKKVKVPSLVSTSELLTAFNNYIKAKIAQPTPSRSLSDLYSKRRQRIQNLVR